MKQDLTLQDCAFTPEMTWTANSYSVRMPTCHANLYPWQLIKLHPLMKTRLTWKWKKQPVTVVEIYKVGFAFSSSLHLTHSCACWAVISTAYVVVFCCCRSADTEKRWPCMLLDGAELSHPFTFTLFTQQQGTRRLDRGPNRERRREETWYNSQKRKWRKHLLFCKELRVELPIVRCEIPQRGIRGQRVFKERTALKMWKIKYVMSPTLPDTRTEGECRSPWPVECGDV